MFFAGACDFDGEKPIGETELIYEIAKLVGNDNIIVTTKDGIEELEISNPKIIQENMVENVVKSLLTGEHLHTCLAEESLETYRIIDTVLEKYYNGRNDDFWNRIDSWNKN